ncbi:hypothetical protein SAMN02745866_01812 [Alteromonadaceae bacterium Bs31]|nr:hypothetical protein SAMN02745866_01812 [Alteromonadaceae bacterium Bs31]
MQEMDTENLIKHHLANTPIGEKIKIDFLGDPQIIEIEMVFAGGWVVYQKVIPGQAFEFVRGEDRFLNSINITISPYHGPR